MLTALVIGDALGPHYEAFLVVREGAGLQRDDALALYGLLDGGVARSDDLFIEDLVLVPPALGVLQYHLVPALQLVQVPEDEPALRPRVAEAVAGDVDVGPGLPREAGVLQVQRAGGELALVARLARVDGDVPHPLELGDRELQPLALRGRRRLGSSVLHLLDVGHNPADGEQDQGYPQQRERTPAQPPLGLRPAVDRLLFSGAGPRPERFLLHGS